MSKGRPITLPTPMVSTSVPARGTPVVPEITALVTETNILVPVQVRPSVMSITSTMVRPIGSRPVMVQMPPVIDALASVTVTVRLQGVAGLAAMVRAPSAQSTDVTIRSTSASTGAPMNTEKDPPVIFSMRARCPGRGIRANTASLTVFSTTYSFELIFMSLGMNIQHRPRAEQDLCCCLLMHCTRGDYPSGSPHVPVRPAHVLDEHPFSRGVKYGNAVDQLHPTDARVDGSQGDLDHRRQLLERQRLQVLLEQEHRSAVRQIGVVVVEDLLPRPSRVRDPQDQLLGPRGPADRRPVHLVEVHVGAAARGPAPGHFATGAHAGDHGPTAHAP